jgi:hypothetical protein
MKIPDAIDCLYAAIVLILALTTAALYLVMAAVAV